MTRIGKAKDLAATSKITVGGELDPKLADNLMELRVETTVGLPDVCMLRFADDNSGDTLPIIDSALFKLGAPLKVKLAKSIGGQLGDIFDGEITSVEAELGSTVGGEAVVELMVTGHDRSHRMHRITTARTFRQVTVVDIAKKMAGEHGIGVGQIAALAGGPAEERHQVGETDWEYLSRLVRGQGGELDVSAGKLHIVDPTKPKGAVAKLRYGESLQRFRPRVSNVGQMDKVDVRGWDPKRKQQITATGTPKATAASPNGNFGTVTGTTLVATAPVSTKAEATARANAAATQIGHERMQGTAVSVGDPLLVAGEYVDIAGVGTRFGGTHRIVSAVHVYNQRGYTTQLTLGAGGRPLAEALGGGRSRGFADNLVIGIVTDNMDPDKLGRVKIRYPVFGQDVESGWARIAWGAAGAERGTVTIPHVNDEVAIGFEHGDVRKPIILGALFNGVDKPGADLVKAASSLASRFPRDLDVATKKKTILASDEGVKVTSSKGPLEIAAAKEVKLAASVGGSPSAFTIETTGQFKAQGKQGVEISTSGPLKITATGPVTVESQAAVQVKGMAITVQASGVLKLSGASVMIG